MVINGITCLPVQHLHAKASALVVHFYAGNGTTDCIDQAIALDRKALEICPPKHPLRSRALHLLAHHLHTRYIHVGGMASLEEAIAHIQAALQPFPPRHPARSQLLSSYTRYITSRYCKLGRMEDINKAIICGQEALSLSSPGHPWRATALIELSRSLSSRFIQLGGMETLDEALALACEALDLHPPGHPNRFLACNDLAVYLVDRYYELGLTSDLDQAVILSRESLLLCPPGHPCRGVCLDTLASCLSSRHLETNRREDLDEAIVITQEALHLRPPGHPLRSTSLVYLSHHLYSRYTELGARDDLEAAIVLAREALGLHPRSYPGRSTSLRTLANNLSQKHALLGGIEYLHEAIVLRREALALEAPGRACRTSSLRNLACDLGSRYLQLGVIEDLDEATLLGQEALERSPPGHPDWEMALVGMAAFLCHRYEQVGEITYLDQAVILGRDLLALSPPGNLDRCGSLYDLAEFLLKRHKHGGAVEDCDEAIVLHREALALCPPGHVARWMSLIGTADGLFSRYEALGNVEDLEQAILLGREAISLLPFDQQDRPSELQILTSFLSARLARSGESNDMEEMFGFYTQLADVPLGVSSYDLSATEEWVREAEAFTHPTTLLAYETSLRFLIQHLTILPSLRHQLNVLQQLTLPLGVDGLSASLRHGSPTKAIELLEQGLGVIWSLASRLRSPLDEVMASGSAGKELADRFKELTSQIQNHTHNLTDGDQRDQAFQRNIELQRVATKIRELSGLSRFLLPSPFADLRQAATGGPVIVANASQYGCDALVILLDRDPVHIPLQITQERVRDLSRELDTWFVLARSVNVTRGLASVLRQLWDDVVFPIVDFLRTIHPCQSRIWWCPTAEFSLLPLHAAGPYRNGEQNLSDIYISSYIPTLSALIRARRPSTSNSTSQGKNFLAVGQANVVGQGELGSIGTELDKIVRRVDSLAAFTRMEGDECSVSRVSEALGEHEWVHFACCALPDEDQPLRTGFAFQDGHLTIQHLIQCELDSPEFAYLSAGHTAIGDKRIPNEIMHLASAMMFAGFRSAIGTMGAVDDGVADRIASTFYDHIVDKKGRLDHTRAAFALQETMNKLVDLPLDQRILYVHLGV